MSRAGGLRRRVTDIPRETGPADPETRVIEARLALKEGI
jgi:hypothetical protein